jgi:hypothetical protein
VQIIRRLVTFVDLPGREPRTGSICARLVAETSDGEVVLLNDRGWSSSGELASQTAEEVEQNARTVVGPDEPLSGSTQAEAETRYWTMLEQKLRKAGIDPGDVDLQSLRHDVEISDRLRRLLG